MAIRPRKRHVPGPICWNIVVAGHPKSRPLVAVAACFFLLSFLLIFLVSSIVALWPFCFPRPLSRANLLFGFRQPKFFPVVPLGTNRENQDEVDTFSLSLLLQSD